MQHIFYVKGNVISVLSQPIPSTGKLYILRISKHHVILRNIFFNCYYAFSSNEFFKNQPRETIFEASFPFMTVNTPGESTEMK